jgi:hypothetical protein
MAIQDICARIDVAMGDMLNTITQLNNVKRYYLKMLGQLRQESDSKGEGLAAESTPTCVT